MLERIRESLQVRLERRNEGGDIEVMRLVDEITGKAVKHYELQLNAEGI
jgi:hypothetical protein